MKNKLVLLLLLLATSFGVQAQSQKQQLLDQRVNQLRMAMQLADSVALNELVHADLSYGHSSGALDNKEVFIQKFKSGKSVFATLDFSQIKTSIVGKTAIVRHALDASTMDNGKPGEVHLQVLLVWVWKKGNWYLLARQAVKRT